MDSVTRIHDVAAALAGYLCGTSVRVSRSTRWIDPDAIAAGHRHIAPGPRDEMSTLLGGRRWSPRGDEAVLAETLLTTLKAPGVHDLAVFGSQARGGTTGYSDVDALLVLDDDVADDALRLRAIRPHVLAAQRGVLAYQPMQHHGFLVATPRLLSHASTALGMPREALAGAVSLFGTQTEASFATPGDTRRSFRSMATSLLATSDWPRHPWQLHRRLSMFELVPTLYLQATGRPTPKHTSFLTAAAEFGASWWPYHTLAEVRSAWPRTRRRRLEVSARVLRNPWLAIFAWRRLPVRPPGETAEYLTDECLVGLRQLVVRMLERVP